MLNTRSTMQLWSKSHDARHRIWSLDAMLKSTADTYLSMSFVLNTLGKLAPNLPLDKDAATSFKNLIVNCKQALNELGIDFHDEYMDDILFRLELGKYASVKTSIAELSKIIRSTLASCLLLRLDSAARGYYDHDKLFGEEVYQTFPESRDDIKEAGTCFALDRYTSAVFHTMRAVEQATKKIYSTKTIQAELHKLKFAQTLGDMARNITEIARYYPKGKIKGRLHATGLHLMNITEAERNPIMHTNRIYSEKEAKLILDNAREFMTGLCSVLQSL